MAEMSRRSELKSTLHIDREKVDKLIGSDKKATGEDAKQQVDTMMRKEFGCKGNDGAWINRFIEGLEKGNKIHMIKSAENLLKLGKIVNDVTDKLQTITQESKYYFIEEDQKVQKFINKCNELCHRIRQYSEMVIKGEKEGDEKPEDRMGRYFKTIMYKYHKEFII